MTREVCGFENRSSTSMGDSAEIVIKVRQPSGQRGQERLGDLELSLRQSFCGNQPTC
jgi:hypothetical protein